MPLYPTSFFIPPTGVPFIVEDIYVRGGYRVVADLAARDAMTVAGRKQGMICRVLSENTLYELIGGTGNTFWQVFDATKYVKLGAPLKLDAGTGTITLELGAPFLLDGTALSIDVSTLFDTSFKDYFNAGSADNGKALVYNHATGSFVLTTITSGSTYTGTSPISVSGSAISLDLTAFYGAASKTHFAAGAGQDGYVLAYDHALGKIVLRQISAGSTLARGALTHNTGSVAAGGTANFTLATGKTAMLLELTLSVPDVTIECHSTAARTDANPYKFKSAAGKLSDDGISVLEDSSLQYNRRYAFLANLEATPTDNTYWKITNNSASAQTISVNINRIKLE